MPPSVAQQRSLVPEFVLSLVPIAFVYALAHYFSLFVTQGQYVVPLLSDPFGRGWDLLGSVADYRPNLAILTPHTIWYVQAGALVAGHVAGLASPTTAPSRSSATATRRYARSTRCSR